MKNAFETKNFLLFARRHRFRSNTKFELFDIYNASQALKFRIIMSILN